MCDTGGCHQLTQSLAFFIVSRFCRQARSDFRLYREETNEEITTKPDVKRCREGKCRLWDRLYLVSYQATTTQDVS